MDLVSWFLDMQNNKTLQSSLSCEVNDWFHIEWFLYFPIAVKVSPFSHVNNFNNISVVGAWSLGRRWLLCPSRKKQPCDFSVLERCSSCLLNEYHQTASDGCQHLYSCVPWGYLRRQWSMLQLFLRPAWTQRKHENPPSPWWVKESHMMYHTGIPVSGQSLSGFLPPSCCSLIAVFSSTAHLEWFSKLQDRAEEDFSSRNNICDKKV